MHLLYISSGKNGITSFTFKELELLEEKGVPFTLLFTQLRGGNLFPKKEWNYLVLTHFSFVKFIFRRTLPILFSKLFYYSLIHKDSKYFLIAKYFSYKVPKFKFLKIHVQMGDHKLFIGNYLHRICKKSELSTTIHAHELYSDLRYRHTLRYKELLDSCAKIFTISNFNLRILVDELGVDPEKVVLMYLYPSFKKNDLAKKKKILMIGNWEPKKGYEDILNSLEKIQRDDFILLIAGKNVNPDVDLNLPEIISKKKLAGKVLLLGHVNKNVLELLYSYCDVFLLPSKTEYYDNGFVKEREGIPVALMEAMSFGLPVISTRHAGIPELVPEFLIDEGDVNGLVDKLNFVLDNLVSVKSQANKNKDIVAKNFSEENINVLHEYLVK
jgi:glycosyltransferase involved in cell wall biosynthesis